MKVTSTNLLHFSNAWGQICVTDEGIDICVNETHSLKELSPMKVTDGGSVISFKFEHWEKVLVSIFLINDGDSNINFSSDEHCSNADTPMKPTEEGIVISVSDEQPINPFIKIFVIEEGIFIFLREVHPPKVDSFISVIDKGMIISVIPLHPLKRDGPNSIAGSDNKRLTISVLFFFAAKYNAVTFKTSNEISKEIFNLKHYFKNNLI